MTQNAGERLKWQLARAIRRSGLDPFCRLILWTLLDLADVDTAVIPPERTPSLSTLAADTGMGRSTVTDHLPHLQRDGWIERAPPPVADQVSKRARTRYRLLLPTGPGAGLVREPDQSENWSGSRTSPGHGPVLVREPDRTGPGAGHTTNTDLSDRARATAPALGATNAGTARRPAAAGERWRVAESEQRRRGRRPLPPVCGECDARPDDPPNARVVWLDKARTQSTPCPRCHPDGGDRAS